MPTIWDSYPPTYRSMEIRRILSAVRAGECAAVVGLSGAGKSNLLGFLAHRCADAYPGSPATLLLDCNRARDAGQPAFLELALRALGQAAGVPVWDALYRAVETRLSQNSAGLCLVLDRFDRLVHAGDSALFDALRALRDAFKYRLTYAIGMRRPLPSANELSELFYAHTLWLGPLQMEDAFWSMTQYSARRDIAWEADTLTQIYALSAGYPGLLRAVCEAHAEGTPLVIGALLESPPVQTRLAEFWADSPDEDALRRSGLAGNPILLAARPVQLDPSRLTAKEQLLLSYLQAHPARVCEKDELIRAVWPEDRIFEQGVRDDSLAQLVRRLREKIEPDPGAPRHIRSVPGRGYRFDPHVGTP